MLTPLDIQNKEFKKGIRGYKEDEVDEFLDQVMIDYEKLFKENSELKENIEKTNQQIEQYKNIEDTLKNTLVVAQNAAEELRASALKKSELIIQEAENKGKEIIFNANLESENIKRNFSELKKQMQIFKTRFKTLLEAQIEVVLKDIDDI